MVSKNISFLDCRRRSDRKTLWATRRLLRSRVFARIDHIGEEPGANPYMEYRYPMHEKCENLIFLIFGGVQTKTCLRPWNLGQTLTKEGDDY